MRVVNKTPYDTSALRKIFLECEKHIFQQYLVHGERKDRHIEVVPHKTDWVGGYAWFHSRNMVIKLPNPTMTRYGRTVTYEVWARRVAQVYLHEVGHNIGLRHKKMKSSRKINVDWLADTVVPLKPVTVKPKPNVVEQRAKHAEAKLAEWEIKLHRAKTYVKKWQRKVKYYQKQTAASN